MFDLSHLPAGAHVREYFGSRRASTTAWHKPPNCKFVYIYTIGGGGGGGSGFFGHQDSTKGGGGGGATGTLAGALFNAHDLPSILYVVFDISSGLGSKTVSIAGSTGQGCYISNYPGATSAVSTLSYAGGGGGGGGLTGGRGGDGGPGLVIIASW